MISEWKPLSIRPQLLSIFVIIVILTTICLVFYFKQRKIKANEIPNGFVLVIEIIVNFIRNMVNEILGYKLDKATPFFIFIFFYICISNIIGILGFDSPTSSYTITLSMALISYFSVWVIGFKYQKLSYFKNFFLKITTKNGKQIPVFLNPLEIVSNFAPIISLSIRLWGNITAGTIITTLWFFFTNWIWSRIPIIGIINILSGLTIAPIRGYFDLISGVIQAMVFTLLTMIYWNMAKGNASN